MAEPEKKAAAGGLPVQVVAATALRPTGSLAEALPGLALEALQLHGLDREKSVGLVLTVMPGSRPGALSFRLLAACFIRFSRVRLSPHCFSTWTISCATSSRRRS